MATAEYIGALISLVSKSDIRYQGLLASINPNEATIALEKVRSWGTEGRLSSQGRPAEEIPPSDHVYDYIMFRAADVKDLKIDDPNPPKQQPAPPQPALNDPAILNSSAPGQGGFAPPAGMYGMPPPPHFGAPGFSGPPPPQFNNGPSAPPQQQQTLASSRPQEPSPAAEQTRPAKSASPPAAQPPVSEKSSADKVLEEMAKLSVSKPAASQPSTSPSSLPPAAHGLPAIPHAAAAAANAAAHADRRTAANGASRPREHRNHREVSGPSMPNKEFDFESANAKFQKHKDAAPEDEAASATAGGGTGGLLDAIPPPAGESPGNFYDKSAGFFDNISSEIKERYERSDVAPAREAQGENGFFDAPGGRGGRGRGGGGRGRGRANRMAEEMKNMQTFGDTGASSSSSGGGGGGGRGGRGRGRGRGGFRGRGGPRGAAGGNGGGGAQNGYAHTGPMRMG